MTHSTPTRSVCEAELARLSAACDSIGATLVELDADSTRKLLAVGPLTGVTAQRWGTAQASIDELWTGHKLLAEAAAAAEEIRRNDRGLGRGSLTKLADAVFGNSVELASVNIPLTQRALLGPKQVSTRCTPGQLLTALETAFDQIRAVLHATEQAWRWQLARLDTCQIEQEALSTAADDPPAELAKATAGLAELANKVTCDPLGTTTDDFTPVEAALARVRAAATSTEELRQQLAAIRAGAAGLLDDLAAAHGEAVSAHALSKSKIAGIAELGPADPTPELAMKLADLTTRPGADDAAQLLAWQHRAQAARDQAHAERDAALALVAERGELRGRLDAYTAKAAQYGLAENEQLSRMAGRARDLLYTAPCDLPAARGAVSAYINAVTASTTTTPDSGGR
jgi:hypothetical protein